MARPHDLPEFPGLPVLACTFPIFENSGLPVLDGSDLPEIGGSTLSAIGGSAGLPDIGDMDHCVRVAKKPKLRERQHMRVEGFPDIPSVGDRFGQDLVEVPAEWLNIELARCSLMERGIVQPKHAPLLFEVFAGCANLSRAAVGSGWQVCPPADIAVAFGTGPGLDLLSSDGRRLAWNIIVAHRPAWVHLAFPCTFWSPMAHFTRNRTPEADEQSRLESLAFVIFTRQVVLYQHGQGRHASFEQPPKCISWDLDIVIDMMSAGNMNKIVTDLCRWGLADPGNGLPFKKAVAICSTAKLSDLIRRCSKMHAVHQRVHQTVQSGDRKGTFRTKLSGEYPPALCSEWVRIMAAAVQSQP